MRLPSLFLAALVAVSLIPAGARAQAAPAGIGEGTSSSSSAAGDATVTVQAAPTSSAAVTGTVPVRFVADDEDESFEVSTNAGTCSTPCELQLPPGRVRVHFVGPKKFSKWIEIPNSPAIVSIETKSALRLGLGIAGTAIGGATTLFSLAFAWGMVMADPESDADPERFEDARQRGVRQGLGGAAVGLGLVAVSVVGGIVTNRTGAPVELDERRADAPRPRLIGLSALPSRGDGMVLGAAFEF